jgi:hypothetical protein
VLRAIVMSCAALASLSVPLDKAFACRIFKQQDPNDIAKAASVYRAQIIDYQLVTEDRMLGGKKHRIQLHAKLTLKVTQVLKGPAVRNRTVYWINSTYGLPNKTEFARTMGFSGGQPIDVLIAIDKSSLSGAADSAQPMVLQTPCSSPFMARHSESVEKKWRTALRESN